MTLALCLLALSALAAWALSVYAPEQRRRQALLDDLARSIEALWVETAPGEHLGVGEEHFLFHKCREDDDLETMCVAALERATQIYEYVAPTRLVNINAPLQRFGYWDVPDNYRVAPRVRHRLYWSSRPRFVVCTEHGVRVTCLFLRFFTHPIPEDPHA